MPYRLQDGADLRILTKKRRLYMQILYHIFIGILIGAGAILPGISSGVLCVIFGIYDKLINSVLNFFKNKKENISFLLPIIIGIIIGVILFGNILKKLFSLYPMPTKFAFMGLILGCIPCLFKIANSKKGFRLHYLLYTLLTFILTIFLIVLENLFTSHTFITTESSLFLVFSGFVMSIGIVIPRCK
jgi:putative membrane protein